MGGYLRFSATGDPAIDAILNALNDAGTAYHNTGQWDEGPEEEGPSYCDLIQEAANAAALARSQPSEWVAKAPVEAIKAAIETLVYDAKEIRDKIEGSDYSDNRALEKIAAEMDQHIESLRAILPSPPEPLMTKTEAK